MKHDYLLFLTLILIVLSSCENDNTRSEPTDYLIGGTVQDEILEYEQTVFDGGDHGEINVFNRLDHTLNVQVYKNGTDDTEGYWSIRVNGVDIEERTLPYTLTGAEGSIIWVDESVQPLKESCGLPEALCFYSGAGVDEVTITIQSLSDRTLTGTFSGRLNHIQLRPILIRDTQDYVEVFDGIFNIRLMIE